MTTLDTLAPRRVADAVLAAERAMAVLDDVRAAVPLGNAANTHGGDPGLHRNRSTVVRHAVTHLVGAAAAAAALEGGTLEGPVVDVGAGTGAFSGLLGDRLGRELHLVDVDERHTALAAAAFPGLRVHTDLAAAPAGAAVTAFEVVEHMEAAEQVGFVASLAARVLPGGVLVLSTPDESGYPGGWSGYAPHVGPLAPADLARVVTAGTGGWPVQVLRVDGPTFSLTRRGAVLQHTANRVWNAAARVPGVERLATSLVHRATRATRTRRPAPLDPDHTWVVHDALATGWRDGTGLVAVALAPGGPGS